MASSQEPIVRYAQREDVPSILQLIRELADYEHEIDSVEATEEKLLATLAFAPSSSELHSQQHHNQHNIGAANIATGAVDTPAKSDPATATTKVVGPQTSPSRPARCLMLFTPEGSAAGMALYFYNYSTWRARPGIYLEDLFVRPALRGKGYGKRLLVELAREVVAMSGGRLEWAVLKWNEPSIRFYESVGARMMSEWVGMRVDGEGLVKLAGLLD